MNKVLILKSKKYAKQLDVIKNKWSSWCQNVEVVDKPFVDGVDDLGSRLKARSWWDDVVADADSNDLVCVVCPEDLHPALRLCLECVRFKCNLQVAIPIFDKRGEETHTIFFYN